MPLLPAHAGSQGDHVRDRCGKALLEPVEVAVSFRGGRSGDRPFRTDSMTSSQMRCVRSPVIDEVLV
jgi:hypothetical protein